MTLSPSLRTHHRRRQGVVPGDTRVVAMGCSAAKSLMILSMVATAVASGDATLRARRENVFPTAVTRNDLSDTRDTPRRLGSKTGKSSKSSKGGKSSWGSWGDDDWRGDDDDGDDWWGDDHHEYDDDWWGGDDDHHDDDEDGDDYWSGDDHIQTDDNWGGNSNKHDDWNYNSKSGKSAKTGKSSKTSKSSKSSKSAKSKMSLRNRNLQSQANRPICQRVFLPTCLPSRRTQRHLWPPQDN